VKYKPKQYAQALAEIMTESKVNDKVVANFLKLLERNNDLKKSKEILNQAENIFVKKSGRRKVVVETARKIDKESVKKFVKKGDLVYEKIRPELIAGVRIVVDDESQLDFSMKRKLQELFK
jgi:F0F1-type ATP synthase delta subunit